MSLKETLQQDRVAAMKSGDTEKRNTLGLLLAAIKQEEIDNQTTLDDTAVQALLTKQAKQRRESIADYEKAGNPEMAASEQAELTLIESYLPQQMGRDEIMAIAAEIVAELGVTDAKGMGQVMGKLMPKLKGQADGRLVNEVVRELLQN
ncbi:MAG: GatB/YqeY domain-containing protein [Ardenticatenaceae bacterium]|nr:GatB/YqeY domain-containing protein [Anaerolineales bacterium]MCB8941523.1 GatB/YqeY domain-containing protein [Ardenticatenaceae bacterium]MCB8974583.1 GatB/YqeY domain-containing protein [Ardenticatenaceae bacterium]